MGIKTIYVSISMSIVLMSFPYKKGGDEWRNKIKHQNINFVSNKKIYRSLLINEGNEIGSQFPEMQARIDFKDWVRNNKNKLVDI